MNLEELLKPFKDASAAWNIDIVQILDEYIEETGFQSDFIDFRSIATLLKGSTNVFARKVDYVYEFATRVFLNCNSNIQTRSKGARRTQSTKDNLYSQVVDLSTLPDLQSYVTYFCGTNPTLVVEDILSRKLPTLDKHINIANVDYKIVPKQPATVLLVGDADNTLPTTTPFYRAHNDMMTGALLLETWNTSALIQALGTPVVDSFNANLSTHLSEKLSKQNQSRSSSAHLFDTFIDPAPVCMVTPLVLSSINTHGLVTPHNSKINPLHGSQITHTTESKNDFLPTIPINSPVDQDTLYPNTNNDSDRTFSDHVADEFESTMNNHNISKPKLVTTLIQAFTNKCALSKLPINTTYQHLIEKLKIPITQDSVVHKSHKKSKRSYLDPHTLQIAKDTRLREIEAHADGFRRCVIKQSLENICGKIIFLDDQRTGYTKKAIQKRVRQAKQTEIVKLPLSSDICDVDNNFSASNEYDEQLLENIDNGICEPPVSNNPAHNSSKIVSAEWDTTSERTEFESIIQKKVLELQREASIYNTSKSTLQWNAYIKNMLSDEENRPQFNMELLLEKYRNEITAKTQLSALCRSANEKYDIVRSFATILQIASEEKCLLSTAEDGDIIIN